jgi:hypothetical protein
MNLKNGSPEIYILRRDVTFGLIIALKIDSQSSFLKKKR